jgi:hypothetical protein
VQARLDAHFPTPGHGVGLSLGWVSGLWVRPILAAGAPRLHHGAPGAQPRRHTRRECPGQPVHPVDVSDDRLATVLEAWGHAPPWSTFEGALNQPVRRVYDLQPAGVRVDRPTASGHRTVTDDGLCQVGPSKDPRPDLAPVQVRLSALEPLGRPVATDVGPGPRAVAPLSRPALARVRAGRGRSGRR